MAFGIPGSAPANGDILPRVQYDARAGRMSKIERHQGPAGWESTAIDITADKPAFVVDFGSLEIGYAKFATTGPDFRMVPFGQALPAQPADVDPKTNRRAFRPAFKVKLWGPKTLDGVREFASAAQCVLNAMDALHNTFLASPEAATGKLPVVRLSNTMPIVSGSGTQKSTNYAPVFDVIQWVDRPADLGPRTVPAPAAKTNGNGAHVAAQPAPVQTDFGGPTYAMPQQAKGRVELINDDIPFAPEMR